MQYPRIFKNPGQNHYDDVSEPSAMDIERAQLKSSFVSTPTKSTRQPSYFESEKLTKGHVLNDLSNEEAAREREYLRSLRAARKESTSMVVGHIYEGKITGIYDYGIFVTFPNRECGLVFINEVMWQGEIGDDEPLPYKRGDIVVVEVISFSPGRGLALSLKRPRRAEIFDRFVDNYKPGSVLNGVITSIKDYGAFVRIAPGVDGLLHITLVNNLEALQKQQIGSTIPVIVEHIDLEHRRVALRDAQYEGRPC